MSRTSNQKETPARWSKPLEWWATRQLIRGLNLVGRVTPDRALAPIGRALGNAAYRTMRRYRVVALENLRRAYGEEWSEARIQETARDSFRHLGITLIEFFLRQPRLSPEQVEQEVRFEGQEYYEEAFARGKGVLLITAHYGNWEMMGPRLARAGYPVSAVSRTADDPGLEQMIESIRTRCGLKQIPRRHAARQGLAALRRNEILAILLDQNTAEGGVFVPFFGYPASTATGPAVFALKTGAALVPTFCIREADGTHRMKTWPPIYPEPTGDRARDVLHLTARVTRVIEEQVRERPELWFWLHNRWKLQPEDCEAQPRRAAGGFAERG
ncbi:MAG TPA: lysophospholipid acyltransferase family protein, partial [Armatimonadota bacterium]|nr:lysophospholipid acyltransferase family protein [Armatimonadota bacterium]